MKIDYQKTINALTQQLHDVNPLLSPILIELIDAKDALLREEIKELRLYNKHLNEKLNRQQSPKLHDDQLALKIAVVEQRLAELKAYITSAEDLSLTKRKLARVMKEMFNA